MENRKERGHVEQCDPQSTPQQDLQTNDVTDADGDYGADSELQRRLSSRHITMIALGSSIGMGLWLGSGKSLANGGPASIFIGYILSGSMMWAVSQSVGEMAVMYPLPSAFVQWSNKYVDPAAGFTLGWCYWCSHWINVANELQGIVTVLGFWPNSLSNAGWITIFWIVIILVNIGAVTWFGEIEVVAAGIKFGWIFVIIISMTVLSAGGGPRGDAIGFRYWKEEPFINGFKGFLSVVPTCIFAMSGSENSGLVAAETSNPRKAVPRAVNSIWLRLSLFYVMGSLMITINVDPHERRLFGAEGGATHASPFVIAFTQAGVGGMAHMMNAIIFISVLSSGSASAYAGSRTLVGLAQIGMAPKLFARADSWGRPWYGLVTTLTCGGTIAYLNVSQSGINVFTWFSNLTSLVTLFGWGMICLSHIRMRRAWKLQGRSIDELPWRSWTWPWAAYWGLFWCMLLVIAEFYLSVWPLHGKPDAEKFFANYICIIAAVVIYSGAKIYYTLFLNEPWLQDAKTIDLNEGRRFYSEQRLFETKSSSGLLSKISKMLHDI